MTSGVEVNFILTIFMKRNNLQ